MASDYIDLETLAKKIEEFFVKDGWELDINENPPPHILEGRWVWLMDANYGFCPKELAKILCDSHTA